MLPYDENCKKNRIFSLIFTAAQRARNRAHAHMVCANGFPLTKEILFDCLIASVVQKLATIEFVENHLKN